MLFTQLVDLFECFLAMFVEIAWVYEIKDEGPNWILWDAWLDAIDELEGADVCALRDMDPACKQ
jgi:hypothetical protein